jgi:hypothetical protein
MAVIEFAKECRFSRVASFTAKAMLFFDFAASAGPRERFMPIELPQNVEEAIGEIAQREPGRLTFRCGDERSYAGPVLSASSRTS